MTKITTTTHSERTDVLRNQIKLEQTFYFDALFLKIAPGMVLNHGELKSNHFQHYFILSASVPDRVKINLNFRISTSKPYSNVESEQHNIF